MSAWVLGFQGLGEGEEVDEKGIGGEKGRNEALMKAWHVGELAAAATAPSRGGGPSQKPKKKNTKIS